MNEAPLLRAAGLPEGSGFGRNERRGEMEEGREQMEGRVLIVDDVPENLTHLKKILASYGLEVFTQRDPRKVVETVRESPPDLILLDVIMPGLTGFDVCKLLKEDPATAFIPILYLSGVSDLEYKIRAFREGGVDYIVKPFQREEVMARVRVHLENAWLRNALRRVNAGLEERLVREVEARRRQEQMLIQQGKMAAMGEMLAFIGHQWKWPLSSVSLLTSCIRRDMSAEEPLTEKKREEVVKDCSIILDNLEFLTKTLNKYQDFLRPGKVRGRFDVFASIRDLLELLQPLITSMKIRIFLEGSEEAYAAGYENEFKQVVMNLVMNARDAIAAKGGGGGIIRIRVRKAEGHILVRVADNGGGVAESLLPDKLFEPYRSGKRNGVGIGLYMSKAIIEYEMEGTLTVANEKEGASFTIRLREDVVH